jgi:DNA transposition AAA+ family ATPase
MDPITLTDSRIPATALDKEKEPETKQRINIPLNLKNWSHLPPEIQTDLAWFHQYLLDNNMTKKEAGAAIQYDESTIHRVLYGDYGGNYQNVADNIRSYRKIVANRAKIQHASFEKNRNTELICGALDYAMASNSIALIMGESGTGKSMTGRYWRDQHNSGRTVFTEARAGSSTMGFISDLCHGVGINVSKNMYQKHLALERAFNKNRMLIIDEANFLLPVDRRSVPVRLETVRKLHDKTGMALGLLATVRFSHELEQTEYMFEQLLGRIDMPVRLHRTLNEKDIIGILDQYFPRPSELVIQTSLQIVNNLLPEYKGRVRALTALLRFTSRMANGGKLNEDLFIKAMATKKKMMGEFQFAKH